MNSKANRHQNRHAQCLGTEDFYLYLSRQPEKDLSGLERHLADCAQCRTALAELLEILHPAESEMPTETLSGAEIEETLDLIRNLSRGGKQNRWYWTRHVPWAAAAAVALMLIGAGAWGAKYFYEARSERYYDQAAGMLEDVYTGKSPSGLRLDLPFRQTAKSRGSEPGSVLSHAEDLFMQALAIRGDMTEARFGLASIYLSEGRYSDARMEFQKIVDVRGAQLQAILGRGVAAFELAGTAGDPLDRKRLLADALADFDKVLDGRPGSVEARYNKIWVLFETGRQEEALEEIGKYLSADPDSIWAVKLRELETRIRMRTQRDIEEGMNRAAEARDSRTLSAIASALPDQAPVAIRYALKRSFELSGLPPSSDKPDGQDFLWAAEACEAAYRNVTGDRSYARLLAFYAGLSPPERIKKRTLDEEFRRRVDAHRRGDLTKALEGTVPLEKGYAALHDLWQLLNLHHLRGNCFYYKADFPAAEAEYAKMLELADELGSPDLIAKALSALAGAETDRNRTEAALGYARRLDKLSARYRFDYWRAYALRLLGSIDFQLNRFDQCLEERTAALGVAYRINDQGMIVKALEDLAYLMERLGRLDDAIELYRTAEDQQSRFPGKWSSESLAAVKARRMNLLFKQGELSLARNRIKEAEDCFEKGLESSSGEMPELHCRHLLGLTRVNLARKDAGAASALADKALALAKSGKYYELEWKAAFLKGMAVRSTDAAAALPFFEEAVDVLEKMRGRIASGEFRQAFLTGRFDPYREIVDIILRSSGDPEKALAYAERSKSITLREYLADHSPKLNEPLPGIPVDAAIPTDTVNLEYFFGSDDVFAFISRRDTCDAIALKVSPREIEEQVEAFRKSIESNDEDSFADLSRKLYDELMDDVLRHSAMNGAQSLIIYPDGPLHLLPFGGLGTPDGKFLVERYNLSYAPSKSILSYCLSLGRGDVGSRDRNVLLLDGTANLTGAVAELDDISGMYGAGSHIVGPAELADAGNRAAEAEILHFAGHSVTVGGKPALVLQAAPKNIYLEGDRIASWSLKRNRLVYLAGCNTGIGPRFDGETPWGLIPAFLEAGAPALIVSLLPCEDMSTRAVSVRFYRSLIGKAISKAEALRDAQVSILQNNRSAGRLAPFTWATSVLIGDPR